MAKRLRIHHQIPELEDGQIHGDYQRTNYAPNQHDQQWLQRVG
ncbi:MAG: hypothetical protein ACR5LC_04005 [Symbiopectobacterium sp.]